MLYILWIIIKIILIVLLCFLCLAAAVILTIMFAALRYDIQIALLDKKANGVVKVSWLFRILSFRAVIADNRVLAKAMVFGRQLSGGGEGEQTGKHSHKRRKTKKKEEKSSDNKPVSTAEEMETEEMRPSSLAEEPEMAEKPDLSDHTMWEEAAGGDGKKRLRGLGKRCLALIRGVKERIFFLWNAAKSKKEQWERVLELYHDEKNQKSLALLKQEGLRILRKIRPQRFRAKLLIGLGEPAATGYFLAAAACLMALYEDAFEIQPDFEQVVAEGSVEIKGKIRLATFALTVLRLWKDKNLRSHVRRLMG